MNYARIFKSLTLTLLAVLFFGQGNLFAQKSFPEIDRALKNQEYDKVIKMVNEKLANDPKNADLYYLKGNAYLGSEALFEAKNAFRQGVGYQGRNPWNYIGLGTVQAKESNFPEAKVNFDKALERSKTDATSIMLGVANGYLGSDKREFLDEAEKMLLTIRNKEPENKFAFVALGDMYLLQNIDELALMNYLEAVRIDNQYLEGWLRVGQLRVKEKLYNEGAEAFTKAIEIDPTFAPAYREMGNLWYKAQKFEKAHQNYKEYVDRTEGDISAEIKFVGFKYLIGKYDEAIELGSKLVQDTSSLVLYRMLGYSYIEKKDTDKGKEWMDKYFTSMKAKSKEKFLLASDYEYLGKLHHQLKEFDKAEENYLKSLEIDAENIAVYKTIADMYSKQKNHEKAVVYYTKFIEVGKPKFKDYFTLANSYYMMKDWEMADTCFATVCEKYSSTHVGFIFRGRVNAQLDPETTEGLAQPYYQKVFEILDPKNTEGTLKKREQKDFVEACQYLGYYYFKQDEDCETAVPYWVKVQEKDPENAGAKQIIEYCNSK